MASSNAISKRLIDRLTDAPKGVVQKGKIQALLDEVATQTKALDKMAKAKTVQEQKEAIVPQSSWIKVIDYNQFVIKIGRAAYPLPGHDKKHFTATSVDEARDIINDIEDLVKNNNEMRQSILAYDPPKKPKK